VPYVRAVLIHVGDVAEGLAWYQRAFPNAVLKRLEAFEFEYLDLGGTNLEIVRVDDKVCSGAAGSVVYWSVSNFEVALAHFESLGANLYRGPMDIENGQRMCQVRDPWGNCIGLRGPSELAGGQRGAEV
jgi:predicted enzyme related to lactoylglutathione lyase